VVNLAGAGVGDKRWSEDYKALIRSSRVDTTRTLALALAATGEPIRFVNASAVGYYGSDRGDDILTEESAPGQGFLAGVVHDWEAATAPAAAAGAPVALARTGLVMDADGGAFAKLVLLTKLGLGGPIGSGRQFWPWISLHDEVRALAWLVDHPELTGAVNVVGPDPLRQAEIAAAIAARLHRPHVVPAPAAALKLVLGEFADDVLGSQRVIPARLVASGFRHDHPSIEDAVAAML
ncbi:MAG: TIGR01777 family oxidoreductase, partial [Candidatus Lutibacillus vidarii]